MGGSTGSVGHHARRAPATIFDDAARHVGEPDVAPGRFGLMTPVRAGSGVGRRDRTPANGRDRSTSDPAFERPERRGPIARPDVRPWSAG